jgi:hypothetical protein
VLIGGEFLLSDPASEVTGDNGILGIGRALGFRVSQGVANNGPLAPGGVNGQADRLTSWLVDVLDREQVELVQFGRVIDDNPVCRDAYNAALMHVSPTDPVHSIKACAPDALAHAQQLGASTAAVFGLVILLIVVVLAAVDYVGAEVFRVGFKAWALLFVIVPAAGVAVTPGPQRQFAKRSALRFVVFGVETAVATVAFGVLVIIMARVNRGSVAGAIGMDHPMAKLMTMLLLAVFGAIGFRALLRGFGDRGIPGPLRIIRGARGHAERAQTAVADVKHARERLGETRERVLGRRNTGQQGGAETTGSKAPGRKAHPQPASGRRPPSSPSSDAPTRPGPSGPGRGPHGGGQAASTTSSGGAAQESPVGTARSAPPAAASATGAASTAARTAATVVAAPEVAAVKAVVKPVGERSAAAKPVDKRRDGGPVKPGAAPGRATTARSPEAPRTERAAPGKPQKIDRAGGNNDHPPARPSGPPPGRTGPSTESPR